MEKGKKKLLWQCPNCGGILRKKDTSMAYAEVIGNATCEYCHKSQLCKTVYQGQFDFYDSDERILQIASARANLEYDPTIKRWRYQGRIMKLATDS